jgi:hypothetical protein
MRAHSDPSFDDEREFWEAGDALKEDEFEKDMATSSRAIGSMWSGFTRSHFPLFLHLFSLREYAKQNPRIFNRFSTRFEKAARWTSP